MNTRHILLTAGLMAALTACGSQKQLVGEGQATAKTAAAKTAKTGNEENLRFMQRVADNALYQKNLVSNLTVDIELDGSHIQAPGMLRMRKDEVIRLQLLVPILRTEVGRVEFTPDYVLFVDRLHKQYVKASYNEVGFLQDNGITFYSLQSLFWNQLLLPGQQKVGEAQLGTFTPDLQSGDNVPVRLHDGKIDYEWTTAKATGQILSMLIAYTSQTHGVSMLRWDYDNFKAFGSKQFPHTHVVSVQTEATSKKKSLRAKFSLSDATADSSWDGRTTLSEKYSQVALEEVLGKLIKL